MKRGHERYVERINQPTNGKTSPINMADETKLPLKLLAIQHKASTDSLDSCRRTNTQDEEVERSNKHINPSHKLIQAQKAIAIIEEDRKKVFAKAVRLNKEVK